MVDFSPSPQIGADITPVRRWGDFSRCRSLVFVPYYQANPFRNYDIPCTGALCSPVRQHPLRRFKHVLEHNKKETDFKGPSVFAAKENSSPRVNAVAAKDEPIKRSTCYPLSNVRNLARRPRRRLPHYSRDEFSPQNIARVSTHSSEAMRLKGSRRLATGDVLQAKRLFEQSVEADPSNGRAWQDLAKAVERSPRGGLRSKLKVLELALRHNSSNPYLWQSLAVLKLRMSKLEEACDHCQQGIQRDSTHASLYVTWATAEEKRCNVATARAIYEKADKLATPSAKLYHSWGRLELRQGSKQRARDLFEKGLSCDSRNHYIWHSLGSIARANGEAGRARYCFSKALESDANNVVVLEERAKLEAHENNYALARAFFSRGATANGTDARILHSWSLFEYQMKSYQRAKELIRSAVRISSKDSILWNHYAKVEAAMGNYPRARALYNRACEVDSTDWLSWDNWSALEHKLGNNKQAAILLQEAFRVRFNAQGAFTVLANNINDAPLA